jgi:hypothetical protein
MIGFTAQRLMELELEGLTGAAHVERNRGRITHRNGHRDRPWETRAGMVELRIPKCAKAATSQPSWSHADWPKRPWLRWCRSAEIDEKVKAFLICPIEGDWPYL